MASLPDKKGNPARRRRIITVVSITAGYIILIGLLAVYQNKLAEFAVDPERFREWIDSCGYFAKLVYVLLCALQVMLAVIHDGPMQIAGGYAFGSVGGTLLFLLGYELGSVVSFLLAQRFGRAAVGLFYSEENTSAFSQKSGAESLYPHVSALPCPRHAQGYDDLLLRYDKNKARLFSAHLGRRTGTRGAAHGNDSTEYHKPECPDDSDRHLGARTAVLCRCAGEKIHPQTQILRARYALERISPKPVSAALFMPPRLFLPGLQENLLKLLACKRALKRLGQKAVICHQRIRLYYRVVPTHRYKIHIFPRQQCGDIFQVRRHSIV